MAIDISSPTAFEREATGVGSVRQLLGNVGRLEGIRRDRDILDRYVTALAADPTADPAQIIKSLAEPQFAPGLLGTFQRIAGGLPGGGGIALPQLQSRLAESLIQPKKITQPFEKTEEQKKRDSDIGLLEREGKKADKGGRIKTGQVNEARQRLKALPAGTLFEVSASDALDAQFRKFVDKLKDKRIVRKKILGFKDKIFGKEAFDIALEEAINEGLRDGVDPASMETAFREWWDRQAEEQKGEDFQEFQSTSEFPGVVPATPALPKPVLKSTAQDIRPRETPRPTTQTEFDAIPKGTIFIDTDGTRVRK